ncbi:MAG: DNA polymerase IV, partial [Clostridium sp.]|nr:DNA polymerase IV [Clostridium sp.]
GKGLPLAVCGSSEDRHGVVLARSQEARVLGVKTGEVIWKAKQKCPKLLVVPPHYDEYLKHSRLARKIYYSYTNQVEPFGLDECWLDVSGSVHLFGDGESIANELKERMKRELGLTISVGVSYNKIFAKMGSDLKKPDAVTVIPKERFKEIVWPQEIDKMLGIGKATKRKLNTFGIRTLGDLACSDPGFLKAQLGINGMSLWQFANGIDDSPVMDAKDKAPVKSIGHGTTCTSDLVKNEEVRWVFQELSLGVSKRLQENEIEAEGVQITVKDNRLHSRQFQCPLPCTTSSSIILTQAASTLFEKRYDWSHPVRALTIRAINLVQKGTPVQLDIFHDYAEQKKKETIDETIYKIREKYGEKSVSFASLLGDIKVSVKTNEVVTFPNSLTK